jgi:hypothetical protein
MTNKYTSMSQIELALESAQLTLPAGYRIQLVISNGTIKVDLCLPDFTTANYERHQPIEHQIDHLILRAIEHDQRSARTLNNE